MGRATSWAIGLLMPCAFQNLIDSPGQADQASHFREGIKKNRLFLGKSPKLWVGGGQES